MKKCDPTTSDLAMDLRTLSEYTNTHGLIDEQICSSAVSSRFRKFPSVQSFDIADGYVFVIVERTARQHAQLTFYEDNNISNMHKHRY